jgi:type IV pilus assembly protein PilN
MKVTLNLASRPFTDLGPAIKRLRIGVGILAGLCLLFLLGLHLFDSQAAAARNQEHKFDSDIARQYGIRQGAQAYMQRPDNAQLLKQAEFLNDRFAEKAFSWTLAMEAMETVLPAGVEVTSIEPQRDKQGQINVAIRVLGPHNESVDLVRNLERSRRFIAPRIDNEAAESSNNPNSRMQPPVSASNQFEYELFAGYNPPTAEELAAQNTKAKEKAPASPGSHNPAAPHLRPHTAHPAQNGRPPYTGSAQLPKPNPGRPLNGGAR